MLGIFPMIASHLKTGLSDQQNHWENGVLTIFRHTHMAILNISRLLDTIINYKSTINGKIHYPNSCLFCFGSCCSRRFHAEVAMAPRSTVATSSNGPDGHHSNWTRLGGSMVVDGIPSGKMVVLWENHRKPMGKWWFYPLVN